VLKLHPAVFSRGDNEVYVRMRVGDSTATDHIRIVKTHSFSKNLVLVYPNPFTTQFTVEGLARDKRYKLTLHALNGSVVFTWFANYQYKYIVVPEISLRKGIYFLEVFDLSTQKVAGGSILLKM
jgi:hypothetical protein